MGKLVVYIWCACGHRATVPATTLGGRSGPDMLRRLRCMKCGALGRAEVRLVWDVEVDPYAAYGVVGRKE